MWCGAPRCIARRCVSWRCVVLRGSALRCVALRRLVRWRVVTCVMLVAVFSVNFAAVAVVSRPSDVSSQAPEGWGNAPDGLQRSILSVRRSLCSLQTIIYVYSDAFACLWVLPSPWLIWASFF